MGIQVGDTFTVRHLLTQEEFNRFATLSGDDNPIHVDPEFSARTHFGKTVAHGMFLYSLVHAPLFAHFPGMRQLSQDLMFPCPSYVGEEVSISLRVVEMQKEEETLRLETIVTRPNGEIGLQGETMLRLEQM